ncbi:MAG: ParB/RepB/Spo0J family partition protein [Thaumarchaeota archaeon]|nr:ParB/RepB/Spo0J family partition protein [Nitrososphaerota archaeon]
MDVIDVELSRLDDNPFNTRLRRDAGELRQLASSLRRSGQITPITIRPFNGRFQIVCGHRRTHAARLLGLKTIRAEVGSFTDEQMLEMSLVENVHRNDLSDYEKGLALKGMHGLGMTYEEISTIVGYSKQHISNLVNMTELFDETMPTVDSECSPEIFNISEHHARLLLQIRDREVRTRTLKLVVSENLSVRDLERMIHKLRSWFGTDQPEGHESGADVRRAEPSVEERRSRDEQEIRKLLTEEFELPHTGSFEAFGDLHAFNDGFSIYSFFPPYHKLIDSDALDKERSWFFKVAPRYRATLRNTEIQFFNGIALVTCCVDYRSKVGRGRVAFTVRGTIVLNHVANKWKIIHEHWSKFTEISETIKASASR